MRLAGGVCNNSLALSGNCRHNGIFSGRHRSLIQENILPNQFIRSEQKMPVDFYLGAQLRQR